MMKITLNKPIKDEKGQALILVLILLLLGGLIITPLLSYMSTGLKVGQMHEARMDELYAADAGIEDAIWKMLNDQVPDEADQPYLLTVNDKEVKVWIPTEDTEITLLINLGVLPDVPASYNKAKPQAKWLVVYTPIESSTPDIYDTYRITGYYKSDQQREILGTGFWIYRYDERNGATEVIPWDATLDNNLEIDLNGDGVLEWLDLSDPPDGVMDVNEANIITEPLIDPGYTDHEPLRTVDHLGRAFIWEWKSPSDGPMFDGDVHCRTQRFTLDPPVALIDGKLAPHTAWLETKQQSISISCSGKETRIMPIIAMATDLTTGKSTTVESYVFKDKDGIDGSIITTIFTWAISLQ